MFTNPFDINWNSSAPGYKVNLLYLLLDNDIQWRCNMYTLQVHAVTFILWHLHILAAGDLHLI